MKNTVFPLICGLLLLLGPTSFRRAPFAPVNLTGNSAELPWAPGDFDDGSQIDLLVVYTQSAVNEHGTEQKMKDYIAGEVTKLNNALTNSGIDLEVNLVHQQLLSPYTEGEYAADLANLGDELIALGANRLVIQECRPTGQAATLNAIPPARRDGIGALAGRFAHFALRAA